MKARELTRNEQRLVEAIAEAGERGITLSRRDMATLSGYGDSEAGRVQVSRALARPVVKAAIIEAAGAILTAGAPSAAGMIRMMAATRDSAATHAARVDLLKLAGAGAAEPHAQGGTIQVNLVLPPDLGTLLAQARATPAQVIEHAPQSEDDRSLAEGEGEPATRPAKRQAKRRDPSPASKTGKPKKGRGGQKRRAKSAARGRRTITPPKTDVSGVGTEGGEG
jgi:hypothetical protein